MKKNKNLIFMIFGLIFLVGASLVCAASITPENPDNTQALTCYKAGDDGHQGYAYRWFKNGNVLPVQTRTIAAGYANANDKIQCEIIDAVFGGEEWSPIIVIRAAGSTTPQPTISGTVSLQPAQPLNNETLSCNYPNDDGKQGYIYRWYKKVNGSSQFVQMPVTQSNYRTVDPSLTDVGDAFYCTVTDAVFGGQLVSNQVVVKSSQPNGPTTPPVSYGVTQILPLNPITTDDLICYVNGDDGKQGYIYRWYRNGAQLNVYTRILDNSYTSKHDTFSCTVIDAVFGGQYPSANINILNAVPTIGQPTITPTTAYTDTTLTCNIGTRFDADNDQVTVSYAWLKNDNIISGQTGTTLSGNYFNKNEVIKCRTTPSDSESSGVAADSNGLTVSNSAPTIGDLPDFTMNSGMIITKDYTNYIADKDLPGETLTLTVSGNNKIAVSISGKSATFVAPAGFGGSETMTFTVTDANGASASDNVVVTVKTAPVANFSFSPAAPSRLQTVSFTDLSFDPDGGSLFNWNWSFGDGTPIVNIQNPTHSYSAPGTYHVTLTVTDDEGVSSSITKDVVVISQLSVDSITCVSDTVVEGGLQSCTIKVSAEGSRMGSVSVTAKFTDGTVFGTCTTDALTGACSVQKTMTQIGSFTIYAIAEKTGYTSDLDNMPQASFNVVPVCYNIQDLKIYNDAGFSVEDVDFFRGENMYVKFRVWNNATNSYVTDAVNQVTLNSPISGGIADLSVEKSSTDEWYYYSLKPIPATHDFKGDSQVFTFAFEFNRACGDEKTVQITIRNNAPKIITPLQDISVVKDSCTTVDLSTKKSDLEDSGSDLTWSAVSSNTALFTVSVVGDALTVCGVEEGTGSVQLTLTDLDLDSDSKMINVNVVSTPVTPVLKIISTPVVNATVGQLYNYGVNVNYTGTGTVTYSLTNGPAGMKINPSTGMITWTPAAEGTASVTVSATDSILTDTQSYTITVTAVSITPVLKIISTPVVNATVGQVYNYGVNVNYTGTGTVTYSLTNGPAGMKINSSTGMITWTPAAEGTASVTVSATDSILTDTQSYTITVIAAPISALNVNSISCFNPVIEHGAQSCSVDVSASSAIVGGATVKLYYNDNTLIDSCTTDSLTGKCGIIFTAGNPGSYTVYATAEKAGYTPDLDKQPTATFSVLPHVYNIINLKTYNDTSFFNEDADFFRGENMYVKFQVTDINNGNAFVYNAVSKAYLESAIGGGRAELSEFKYLNDGWYYYALSPIPLNHLFIGSSQVFTFAFKSDMSGGGEEQVNVMIRNNIPTISIPARSVSIAASEDIMNLADYANDLEDSKDKLNFTVSQSDNSVADLTLQGSNLKIKPKKVGNSTVTVSVTDLDGGSSQTTFTLQITSAYVAPQVLSEPEQHLKLAKIGLPFDESAKAGEKAVFSFNVKNDGDLDSKDVKITAIIDGIANARRSVGPFRLDKGISKTVYLSIDVPKDAKEGLYNVLVFAYGENGQINRVIAKRVLRVTQ